MRTEETAPSSGDQGSGLPKPTLRPDGFLRKPEFQYHDFEDLRAFMNFYSR